MEEFIKKLCILYDGAENKYAGEASQVKIIFRPESKNLEKYIEINSDKQIYMVLNPECYTLDNMRRITELKKFDNWTLVIPVSMILDKQKKIDVVKFTAIKECCNKYMFSDLIGNWEILNFVLALHPSEVYITNMLGFCLPDVIKVCGDVGVRAIANVAQSAWEGSYDLTKFFIRPEDLHIYAPLLSGIEFEGDNTIQEVCYGVYKRGYWFGNVGELIIGFNIEVDSRRLPPQFGEYRLKCKKRCITGSRCHLCKAMSEFAEALAKGDAMVTPYVKRQDDRE